MDGNVFASSAQSVFATPVSVLLPRVLTAVLAEVEGRHRWPAGQVQRLAEQGAANHTYALGEELLRIARPEHADDLAAEAAVLPLALAAGLPVPELLQHHPAGEQSPAWMLQRRCPGMRLDTPDLSEPVRSGGHHSLGRVLRDLHEADLHPPEDLPGAVGDQPRHDVHQGVQDSAAAGWISAQDARWLHAWFDELAGTPGASAGRGPRAAVERVR